MRWRAGERDVPRPKPAFHGHGSRAVLVVVQVMLDGNVEQHPDVAISDPVVHLAPAFGGANQSGEAQLTKLMARRGLRGVDQTGKITDADLPSFEEGVDDPKPVGVGEQAETRRKRLGVLGAEQGD